MDYDEFTRNLKAELRDKGRTESGPLAGHPLMILTTRGARTGAEREAVVTYSRQDGNLVIAASKSGAPTNPAWYHNLRANPEVKVEANRETFRARARVTQGEERDRRWEEHASALPWFREYTTKTDRVIPVIVLERVA